ncbi:MAG: hypothetical protein M0Z50_01045 [Planctomycetia bacterium]|jgi:hypothetical protein|nr:hypothetical protein [Planctomycetia bacterium]
MTTFKGDKLPTATAHQSRLRLFQPTRRPKSIEEVIKTPWGTIRIKGRLGQAHANILEAMLSHCEKHAKLEDGRIKLLIDPYQIMKTANQTSWSTFKKNLDDLMQAIIEIKEPDHLKCIGHLIDHIDKAVRSDGTSITKHNPLGGEREMWRVEIGKAGTMLIESDLKLFYKTQIIASLKYGISQAVARHILTHKTEPNGGWKVDVLIFALCPNIPSYSLKDRRNELAEDAPGLLATGLKIENKRIHLN